MAASSLLVLSCLLLAAAAAAGPSPPRPLPRQIIRHHQGDIFGFSESCDPDVCQLNATRKASSGPTDRCQCQCDNEYPTFRDDTHECVTTIRECTQAYFVSHEGEETIPYIFMPHMNQLVHPRAQIVLKEVKASDSSAPPVCLASRAEFLRQDGWTDLGNTSSNENPFQLFRFETRVYLQWYGDQSLRRQVEGRVVLVHLTCKVTTPSTREEFHPCVAFRVAGITDYLDHAASMAGADKPGDYFVIGICAGVLVAIYLMVLAVLVKHRRRRKKQREAEKNRPAEEDACLPYGPHDYTHAKVGTWYPGAERAGTGPPRATGPFPQNPLPAGKLSHFLARMPGIEALDQEMSSKRGPHFDPDLTDLQSLRSFTPEAEEFIGRIRELMDATRQRMATRRFSPTLCPIAEEEDAVPAWLRGESEKDHSASAAVAAATERGGRVSECSRGVVPPGDGTPTSAPSIWTKATPRAPGNPGDPEASFLAASVCLPPPSDDGAALEGGELNCSNPPGWKASCSAGATGERGATTVIRIQKDDLGGRPRPEQPGGAPEGDEELLPPPPTPSGFHGDGDSQTSPLSCLTLLPVRLPCRGSGDPLAFPGTTVIEIVGGGDSDALSPEQTTGRGPWKSFDSVGSGVFSPLEGRDDERKYCI